MTMHITRKCAIGMLIAATLCFGTAFCQDAAPPVSESIRTPKYALDQLQAEHAVDSNGFVLQGELDVLIPKEGGGACASAVAIDAYQCLRLMAGIPKLENPHKAALSAFAHDPELLKGRVTNERLLNLLSFYGSQLGGYTVSAVTQSAPNSVHANGSGFWDPNTGPMLDVKPLQLKILSFTWTLPDGHVLGRHFVLLKDFRHNEIVVIDPHSPTKERTYVMQYKKGNAGEMEQVFLLNPVGVRPREDVFELNTVFDITLSKSEPDATNAAPSTSLESIKAEIDSTANALRGTDDFLNPRVWREKTARFGLPGLDLPVKHGGMNWPATKAIEIFRHAGRHNLNFRDNVGGAHVRPLLKSSNPAMHDIVKQVAKGTAYIAIAITEPEVGSDVTAMKSVAKKVDGGYRLTGKKRFNARLNQATHVIVFTQSATGKAGKISVFVLPIDTPGLVIETLKAHGLTGNSYGGLSFQDVFVPEENRLGEDGEGMKIFFDHFDYWRLMQSVAAIGTAENALDQMVQRIRTRHAFGGPIGRFTHLQQPIGQYRTQLSMAYALAREAAEMIDRGDYESARPLIFGLKAEGVEIALGAVDAATRAFGGEGYSGLVDVGDRLRDLNGLRIADGTTDVMRMNVVRSVYGRDLWNMAIETKSPVGHEAK